MLSESIDQQWNSILKSKVSDIMLKVSTVWSISAVAKVYIDKFYHNKWMNETSERLVFQKVAGCIDYRFSITRVYVYILNS